MNNAYIKRNRHELISAEKARLSCFAYRRGTHERSYQEKIIKKIIALREKLMYPFTTDKNLLRKHTNDLLEIHLNKLRDREENDRLYI